MFTGNLRKAFISGILVLLSLLSTACVTMMNVNPRSLSSVADPSENLNLTERKELYDKFSLKVVDGVLRAGAEAEGELGIELGAYMALCKCDKVAKFQKGKDGLDNLVGGTFMLTLAAPVILGLGYISAAGPGERGRLDLSGPTVTGLSIASAVAALSAVWIFHWGPSHQDTNVQLFNDCLRHRLGLKEGP